MSAAFNTIDHDVLPQQLQNTFSIEGTALNLIRSYIYDPHSYVKSGSGQFATSTSDIDPLLWPRTLHTLLQIWRRSRSASAYSTISTPMTSACTSSPANRISPRKYRQLNVALTPYTTGCRTTALPLTHKSRTLCSSVSLKAHYTNNVATINATSALIALSPSIKSLGFTLDSHLRLDDHVTAVSKA